jgi:hypothetical protein
MYPLELTNSISCFISIKNRHRAIHKYEPILKLTITLSLLYFFVGVYPVDCLIYKAFNNISVVSGLQDNFEAHQVVWLVIHDQDSALEHFDRLGTDALEVQLCPMGANVAVFAAWDVSLRHFYSFVKLKILLLIIIFLFGG